MFEFGNPVFIDARFLELFAHLVVVGRCEQGTNREEIALNGYEYFVNTREALDATREANRGVQFVDVAVGFDTRVILAYASAAKQRGAAFIAGSGVDLHALNYSVAAGLAEGDGVASLRSMRTHEIRDLTIIGAGPTGLFALFYAGMRGATAQIVDALPELGGQLAALYPEKDIFDVAGFPRVPAKDLVRSLSEQALQFHRETGLPAHMNQQVVGLEEEDGHYVLVTETDRFPTRAIVIAAGIGAFKPRRLPQAFAAEWYGRGVSDLVTKPSDYQGKHVVIIGGGDSAFDWAAQLRRYATHVTLVHRSDRFRAHAATVAEVMGVASEGGNVSVHTFHELEAIHSEAGDVLSRISLKDIKAKTSREVQCDVLLPMLGYVSDLGAMTSWGLSFVKDEIAVNTLMEAGRAGIYAAGDITTYDGKLKLIACGFSEAAIAVNQAVHWVYPDKKVAPGHSSNMAVFGQTD